MGLRRALAGTGVVRDGDAYVVGLTTGLTATALNSNHESAVTRSASASPAPPSTRPQSPISSHP